MTELHASRTLVKSPPELWAECSEAASLARHLDRFGEIRITRLEPETAVAWEGEHARGTVRIEPAGWGTRVSLTATAVAQQHAEPPVAGTAVEAPPVAGTAVEEPPPDPPAVTPASPASAPRRRRFARLWAFLRGAEREPDLGSTNPADPEPVPADPPVPEAVDPAPAPESPPPDAPPDTEAALAAALDSLGQAHRRPYSRA